MKDLLIIFGLIVAAIAIGVGLYFYGPSTFRVALGNNEVPSVTFRVLKEGQDATGMTERANYRIQNPEQMSELWGYLGATPGTAPNIDFTKEEVLAVFDGTHTTGGYAIQVTDINDANGTRTVYVMRQAPGAGCTLSTGITAPYQIIAVPKSDLTLTHIDAGQTQDCR